MTDKPVCKIIADPTQKPFHSLFTLVHELPLQGFGGDTIWDRAGLKKNWTTDCYEKLCVGWEWKRLGKDAYLKYGNDKG